MGIIPTELRSVLNPKFRGQTAGKPIRGQTDPRRLGPKQRLQWTAGSGEGDGGDAHGARGTGGGAVGVVG